MYRPYYQFTIPRLSFRWFLCQWIHITTMPFVSVYSGCVGSSFRDEDGSLSLSSHVLFRSPFCNPWNLLRRSKFCLFPSLLSQRTVSSHTSFNHSVLSCNIQVLRRFVSPQWTLLRAPSSSTSSTSNSSVRCSKFRHPKVLLTLYQKVVYKDPVDL